MFLIPILLGLLPGFAWLVFYLSEDPHPEPKRLVVFTFFAGIAFGFFTVVLERTFDDAAAGVGIALYSILSLVGLALIEESMKFAAAFFAISRTPEMSDPIDPMIYMIVAALGFATLENIGTIANIPHGTPLLTAAFQTISLRFVGATLLHSLASGFVGYCWSVGIKEKRPIVYVILGTFSAALLHATFNYLTLTASTVAYSVAFLVVVGFFVLVDFEKLKAQEPA